MEKENNKSKSISALIWVAIFLTLFGIVIAIIYAGARLPALRKLLVFAGYAMVIFYGAYGYRQPHGNLLRYVIVIFAFLLVMENYSTAISTDFSIGTQSPENYRGIEILLTSSAAVSASYIGGRLNKFKKNRGLFAFVLVLLILRCLFSSADEEAMFVELGDAILWVVIAISYFLRYTLHKEAASEVL